MAKDDDIINIFHANTIEENEAILLKLRARYKNDNKTSEEWAKTFQHLNCHCLSSIEKSPQGRLDQLAPEVIYGPIAGFPSGSWWGIRMDCSRDQVHIPFDKDIHDGPFGVTSICTSHVNVNNDIDLGTFLTFTGGEYTSDKPHDPLYRNYQNNIPIRVVRSYHLANKFAPQTGYRYDGLYTIVSTWKSVLSDSKQVHKYALARLKCQEPPPWALPSRTSVRLKNSTEKATHGASRCRKYEAQVDVPEMKRKKIEFKTSVNKSLHKFLDSSKIAQESTIVQRHVSKRIDGSISHGINKADSPIQPSNIVMGCSPKIPPCKLQTTNISIRTDLYDSSPNHLQDMKRSTPMTFCRMYSSNRAPAKPLNQISLNASRLDEVPKEHISKSMMPECQEKICSSHKVATSSISLKNQTPEAPYDDDSEKFSGIDRYTTPESASQSIKNNESSLEGLKVNKKSSRRSSGSSLSSTDSVIRNLNLPEAVVAIEAMSPEQMLNLIVKKRYNPTGKLLIGSIIGLPPNDESLKNEIESQANKSELANIDQDKSVDAAEKNLPNTEEQVGFPPSKSKKPARKNICNENKRSLGARVHLNRPTVTKAFSKSTVPKKRRGELANLAIDANFVTNFRHGMIQTRKTSGRQLRCSTIIINQRREFAGFITNYTRFDLAKKSKRRTDVKTSSNAKKKQTPKINAAPILTNVSDRVIKNPNTSFVEKTKSKEPKKSEQINPKMIDASIQCNFQKDPSTLVNTAAQTINTTPDLIDNTDIENYAASDSDCDSIQEIIYENVDSKLSRSQEESKIIKNDRHLSAFAPVNTHQADYRIARLRMIGFKPISSTELEIEDPSVKASSCEPTSSKRDVNERYNKYANEENDIVEYLDDELHFEDLENEVSTVQKFKSIITNRKYEKKNIMSLNTKTGSSSGHHVLRKRR